METKELLKVMKEQTQEQLKTLHQEFLEASKKNTNEARLVAGEKLNFYNQSFQRAIAIIGVEEQLKKEKK